MRFRQLTATTSIRPGETQAGWVLHITDYGAGMMKATAAEWKYRDPGLDDRPRNKGKPVDTEKARRRSASRSRKKVYDAIMMMRGDRMLTLTYRKNQTCLDAAWRDWKQFVRQARSVLGGDFEYVVVPERQKRGAWHFHVVLNRYIPVEKLRAAWRAVLGGGSGANSPGETHIKWMGNTPVSVRVPAVARYLSKYITKEAALIAPFRRRYAVSRGIDRPVMSMAMMRGVGDWHEERLALEYLFFCATGKPAAAANTVEIPTNAGGSAFFYSMRSYRSCTLSEAGKVM